MKKNSFSLIHSAPSLQGRAGGESGSRFGSSLFLFLELVIITIVAWVVLDPAVVNLYYRSLPLGYDADRLLYAEVAVGAMAESVGDPYEATEERRMQLMRQLKAVDGVENVYFYSNWFSAIGNGNPSYSDVSYEQDTMYLAGLNFIPGANFFETYGIQPLPGSPSAEELSRTPILSRQAVLTRSAATSLFGTADVAGRHFQIQYDEPCDMTVAGVVEDVRIGTATSTRSLIMIPERLEAALKIAKADRVINYAKEDKAKALAGCRFDRVVDAVGASEIILEASKYLRPFGVVCCLGVLRKNDSSVDLSLLQNNTFLHMLNFPYEEYACLDENLDYIRRGLIDPKNFYSHVLPMEEVEKALELVVNKQTTKVILKVH